MKTAAVSLATCCAEKLKSGEIKPAVPLHFIFGADSASPAVSALFPQGGTQLGDSQVWFLGQAGIATVAGLSVAFIGGSSPSKQDAAKLLSAHEDHSGVVDVLLSCAWPAGFQKHCPASALPSLPAGSPILPAAGNLAVATVAAVLKPRYHFVGTYGVFYQRPPFPNTPLKAVPEQWHLTRMIALGDVNSTGDKSKKYLHALSIAPGQAMAPSAPGCTKNPFDSSAPAPPGAGASGGGDAAVGGGSDARGVKRARTDAGPMNDAVSMLATPFFRVLFRVHCSPRAATGTAAWRGSPRCQGTGAVLLFRQHTKQTNARRPLDWSTSQAVLVLHVQRAI